MVQLVPNNPLPNPRTPKIPGPKIEKLYTGNDPKGKKTNESTSTTDDDYLSEDPSMSAEFMSTMWIKHRPRPRQREKKTPTITGITPSRVRGKGKKSGSRSKKMFKALKQTDFKMQWKGAVWNLMKMRTTNRVGRYFRARKMNGMKRALDIKHHNSYTMEELGKIKRASMLLNISNPRPRPLSMMSIDSAAFFDNRRRSDVSMSVYTERPDDFDVSASNALLRTCLGHGSRASASVFFDYQRHPDISMPVYNERSNDPGVYSSNDLLRTCLGRGGRGSSASGAVFFDYRRDSDMSVSVYSERPDDPSASSSNALLRNCLGRADQGSSVSTAVNGSRSLRASLLPYEDWLLYIPPDSNPYVEDLSSEPTHSESTANTTTLSTLSSPSFSSPYHHPQTRPSPLFLHETLCETPSPTSSEVTITPWSTRAVPTMSQSPEPSPLDPFIDSVRVEGQEENTDLHQQSDRMEHPTVDENSSPNTADVDTSTPNGKTDDGQSGQPDAEESSFSEAFKSRDSSTSSRIPRASALNQNQNQGGAVISQKGRRVTPERRSAIPVPVRKQSADQLSTSQNTPGEGASSSDESRRPRSHIFPDGNSPSVPDIQETRKEGENSSSTVSSWDFGEKNAETTAAPFSDDIVGVRPIGFTGDNRQRPTRKSLRDELAPKVKKEPDADSFIMGRGFNSDNGLTYTPSMITKRSRTPSHEDKTTPKASGHSGQLASQTQEEASEESVEDTPRTAVRNFSQIQLSQESIPKRNFSGDLPIPRKPLGTPSMASLVPVDSQGEERSRNRAPPIPEDWRKHFENSISIKPDVISNEDENGINSSKSESLAYSVPGKIDSSTSFRSHPPRTSSLNAMKNLPPLPDSDDLSGTPAELHNKPGLKTNVTFDEIVGEEPDEGQPAQSAGTPKLSDSKSTRMLDSFRHIFSKTKTGADKGRVRSQESPDAATAADSDQALSNTKRTRSDKTDSVKPLPKTKSKYSKLSDGMSWNKTPRSHKAGSEVSPAAAPTPESSRSSAPTQPGIRSPAEDRTPSFARPTQATRTKAAGVAIGTKGPAFNGQEIRNRRPHLTATSSGSPQLLGRTQKRSISAPISQPRRIPGPSHEELAEKLRTPATQKKDGMQGDAKSPKKKKDIESVRQCVELLCTKARNEALPNERERSLRLALALQEQISDFHGIEREFLEIEALYHKKKVQKSITESNLFEYFSEVQEQMDENKAP